MVKEKKVPVAQLAEMSQRQFVQLERHVLDTQEMLRDVEAHIIQRFDSLESRLAPYSGEKLLRRIERIERHLGLKEVEID